jgi:hypothetical protein
MNLPTKFVFTPFEKRETLKVRMSKGDYQHLLAYFEQKDQLRINTGTAYYQGNGWYEIHLNTNTFTFAIAVRRFMECVRVAFSECVHVLKSKRKVAENAAAILAAMKGVHSYNVVYRRDPTGRTVPVVLNRAAQAIRNRDADVLSDFQKVIPASSDRLQSLAQMFARH